MCDGNGAGGRGVSERSVLTSSSDDLQLHLGIWGHQEPWIAPEGGPLRAEGGRRGELPVWLFTGL